jgi:hypothetical protein
MKVTAKKNKIGYQMVPIEVQCAKTRKSMHTKEYKPDEERKMVLSKQKQEGNLNMENEVLNDEGKWT